MKMEDGEVKAADQVVFRTVGKIIVREKIETTGKKKVIPVKEIAEETMITAARRKKKNQTETITGEAATEKTVAGRIAAEKTAAGKISGLGEKQMTILRKDAREKMDVILTGGF